MVSRANLHKLALKTRLKVLWMMFLSVWHKLALTTQAAGFQVGTQAGRPCARSWLPGRIPKVHACIASSFLALYSLHSQALAML